MGEQGWQASDWPEEQEIEDGVELDDVLAAAVPRDEELQAQASVAGEAGAGAMVALADLQRVSAEYANYRKRMAREKDSAHEASIALIARDLMPIADDVERARANGELDGVLKSIGERLEQALVGMGLERYGQPGDAFDPVLHEALTHTSDDQVGEPTVTVVYESGYRLGERIVRPARVAVVSA